MSCARNGTPPRLVIVCGLPGSGKTTYSTRLAAALGAVRFEPDEWMEQLGIDLWDEDARARIEALQWDLAQDLLRLGQSVVIEWGTWARSERDTLRDGARRLGAAVELHYLDVPLDELYRRITARGMEDPSIQRSDLDRWAEVFEVPTEEELALYDPRTEV